MVKEKSNNIRLGLFVIVASILLISAVYFIGSNKNIFGSNFVVTTILTNAGGLQPGNNVRYAGINVGTVQRITIVSDATVKVDLRLVNQIKPFIRKDAITSVSVDGIVGSALINISPGSGTALGIEAGDTLQATNQGSTGDLIAALGGSSENLAIFTRDLLDISGKIKQGPGTISNLLGDSSMATDLRQTLTNLHEVTRYTLSTVRKLESTTNDIQKGQGMINQLLYDTVIMTNLRNLSINMNESISGKLDTMVQHLENTTKNLSVATDRFNRVLHDIKNGDGVVSHLLYNPDMANSFEKSLENIQKSTVKLDENLEALKHNFLFRRYFKKQEKQRKKDSIP